MLNNHFMGTIVRLAIYGKDDKSIISSIDAL